MDIARIEPWLATVGACAIDEFRLQEAGCLMHFRRRVGEPVSTQLMPAGAVDQPAAEEGPPAPALLPASTARAAASSRIIEAPMMGTLYLAANPGGTALAPVGSTVKEGSTVCVIEAMKILNEIDAGVSGTVLKVLAEDGAMVQPGQPLFEIR